MESNRLIHESSPYLLQHAHNPVDWYPWGAEAFEKARGENKPIFLSVGYSTCYWCHVMERQSFENEAIAAEMNRLFVNIKVDREQRPDVDQIYMTAVQVMTRHGGWPMSVWLTPDLKPFYAGTYFPPTDVYGRPGFPKICQAISEAWQNRRREIEESAEEMTGILGQLAKPQVPKDEFNLNDAWINKMIDRSTSDYDEINGGFGSAPKFPRETLLRLLLIHQRTFPNEERMHMIRHTLDAMAAGGIRDHLGGGFHRYSTDARWLVPHFEIMLYDNAMLAWIYAEAFAQTGVQRYEQVARRILDFLLREMRSPDGSFYTALDAEVDAMEGASYLWTLDEVRDVLGDADAEIFSRAYGLNAGPNFVDPHHGGGQPEKNVLFRAEFSETIAKSMNVETTEIDQRLAAMREKLYLVRRQRKQPSLDNKILISWNALTITAFAHAGRVFADQEYLRAGSAAADSILNLRKNKNQIHFLDDDAFLADALLELHSATHEARWRDEAKVIVSQMQKHFGDPTGGAFYFTSEDAKDLIVRQKIGTDSPLPAGNSVGARVLIQLSDLGSAGQVFSDFGGQLQSQSESMSAMLEAAHVYLRSQPPLSFSAKTSGKQFAAPDRVALEAVEATARWQDEHNLITRIQIQGGFHINGPDARGGLVPTQIFTHGAGRPKIEYPPVQSIQIAGETLEGYVGAVEIRIHLPKSVERQDLRVELQYQACDETRCLAPIRKTIPM